MTRSFRFFALSGLLFFTNAALSAQTVIDLVTDAASYAPRVAPGELATIFGTNLADYTQQASSFPLPTSMAGATVYVNSVTVRLLYVSTTQINFQVPSNLAAGTANMYVSRDGGRSALYQFSVVSSSPGIFQNTSNDAIAQNATNYVTNSSSNPVASGDVLVVYLTGLGAVSNPVADGTATPNSPLSSASATATATIGLSNATVQFLGLTPGFAGLAQANIVVPTLATGSYPLVINVGGYVSASAEVYVSGSGTAPPTYLTLAGQVNFPNGAASSVAIYGDYTYLCGPNQINIVDTSDAADPVYIGYFGNDQLAGYGGKCAVNLSTSEPILVDIVGPGDAPTFTVYSLAEPTEPTVLTTAFSTTPYTFLNDISFLGTTAYVSTSWFTTSSSAITAQYGNFVAYDFTSLYPELVSVLSSGPGSSGSSVMPNSLTVVPSTNDSYPNTAYIMTTTATGAATTGSAALDVVNISTPSSMEGLEQVTDSKAAIFLGAGYDHPVLLATGNTTSFQYPGVITGNLTLSTMNVNNVDKPTGTADLVTSVSTMGTYVVQPLTTPSVTTSDIFAIVNEPPSTDPTGPSSLMIVNAATPSSPVLYPLVTQFGLTDVAAVNGYLLVPNVNGLQIYTIQAP